MDFAKAARAFSEIQADMIHRENSDLCGDEFYGEALRRLFDRIGYKEPQPAESPRELHAGCWAALESVQREQREQYARYTADLRDAAGTCAASLRARCNEVAVPSRYRREGVLLAALWLDGKEG